MPLSRVYCSGDCVCFDGREQLVCGVGAGVHLLPVNGRDEYRVTNGISVNFPLAESVHFADAILIELNGICSPRGVSYITSGGAFSYETSYGNCTEYLDASRQVDENVATRSSRRRILCSGKCQSARQTGSRSSISCGVRAMLRLPT